jgi:outer membrane protease
MPNVNIYICEQDYIELVYLAQDTGKKVSQLAQEAITKFLEGKKVKA